MVSPMLSMPEESLTITVRSPSYWPADTLMPDNKALEPDCSVNSAGVVTDGVAEDVDVEGGDAADQDSAEGDSADRDAAVVVITIGAPTPWGPPGYSAEAQIKSLLPDEPVEV